MTDDIGPAQRPDTDPEQGPGARVIPIAATQAAAEDGESPRADRDEVGQLVEEPAKVMRIGTMIKQLLEEVRAAPLDEKARDRLRDIHERSIVELEAGLSGELNEELGRLSLPFSEGTPSESELRIAQAQLVGWLEGLFHGIQSILVARQVAAQQLAEQRMRALPRGAGAPGEQVILGPGGQVVGRAPGAGPAEAGQGTGQYL